MIKNENDLLNPYSEALWEGGWGYYIGLILIECCMNGLVSLVVSQHWSRNYICRRILQRKRTFPKSVKIPLNTVWWKLMR